jgi:hypothetical protein
VANVQFSSLSIGIQRLTRRIGEIAKLGVGEAKPAIEALGLSVEELVNLRADEQFELILDALGGVANASERAALAMKFFDVEGVALLQLAGRTKELREESQRLRVVMDRDMIQTAVEAREQMKRLEGAVEGVRNRFAQKIVMQIDEGNVDRIFDLVDRLGEIAGETISTSIKILAADTFTDRVLRNLALGDVLAPILDLIMRADEEDAKAEGTKAGTAVRSAIDALLANITVGSVPITLDTALLERAVEEITGRKVSLKLEVDESELLSASKKLDALADKRLEDARALAVAQDAEWQRIMAIADAELARKESAAGTLTSYQRMKAGIDEQGRLITGNAEGMREYVGAVREGEAATADLAVAHRTAHAAIQQHMAESIRMADELGATLVDLSIGWADRFAADVARNARNFETFMEAAKRSFSSFANHVIAELVRIAARQAALGLLKLFGFAAAAATGNPLPALISLTPGPGGAEIPEPSFVRSGGSGLRSALRGRDLLGAPPAAPAAAFTAARAATTPQSITYVINAPVTALPGNRAGAMEFARQIGATMSSLGMVPSR